MRRTGQRSTRHRGDRAETAALWYLRRRGLRLLERNYSCRFGEIDLVCWQARTIVFVEVRLRDESSWTTPAESVTRAKQRKLLRTAEHFIAKMHDRRGRFGLPSAVTDYRFDVVSVTKRHCRHRCSWIRNAFTA